MRAVEFLHLIGKVAAGGLHWQFKKWRRAAAPHRTSVGISNVRRFSAAPFVDPSCAGSSWIFLDPIALVDESTGMRGPNLLEFIYCCADDNIRKLDMSPDRHFLLLLRFVLLFLQATM
jgi:hypothetical protein